MKSADDIDSKDAFLYRSYIALNKYSIPVGEIDASFSPASHPLGAIRRFAEYMANANSRLAFIGGTFFKQLILRKRIVEQVTAELEKGNQSGNEVCALMNSFIFNHEGVSNFLATKNHDFKILHVLKYTCSKI